MRKKAVESGGEYRNISSDRQKIKGDVEQLQSRYQCRRTIAELDHLFLGVHHARQRVGVDIHGGHVIHEHADAHAGRRLEQMLEQRRLAGAEPAAHGEHGHLGIGCRFLRHGCD